MKRNKPLKRSGFKRKPPKKKKKRAETKPQLIRKLDAVFSKYIRLRDSDDNGYGECVTCKTRGPIWHITEEGIRFLRGSHAGHFVDRGIYPLRWDETNVHLQCPGCNTYRGGAHREYTIYMIDRYGRGYVDTLLETERLYKGQGQKAFGIGEIRDLLAYWTEKYESLLRERGLK